MTNWYGVLGGGRLTGLVATEVVSNTNGAGIGLFDSFNSNDATMGARCAYLILSE